MQERDRQKEPFYKKIMPKTESERALVKLGFLGGGAAGTNAGLVGTLIGMPVGVALALGVNVITRRSQKVS